MTWGLQQTDYASMPVPELNPFNTALKSGLDTYQKMVKNKYLPEQLQAEIASKQAYSQFLPYQNIATVAGNPLALALMSPEQRSVMFSAMGNMASNIGKQPTKQESGGVTGLWNNLMSSLGLGGQQPSQSSNTQPATTSQQSMNDYLTSHPDANQELKNTGQYTIPNNQPISSGSQPAPTTNQPASSGYTITPQEADSSGFDMSSPGANALGIDTGSKEGNRALALKMPSPALTNAIAANKAQQTTTVSEKAKLNEQAINDLKKESAKESMSSFNLLNNATKFVNAYDKAWGTGVIQKIPGGKWLSEFDPSAEEAKNYANNMGVQMASMLFGNKQSDYREKLALSLKLDPSMPKDAVHHIFDGIQAEAGRIREFNDFVQYATDKGMNDANKIRNLWVNYNFDKPFYDVKEKKVINKNLNSYSSYIDQSLKGSTKTPSSGVMQTEHNGKKYIHINGRWESV